MLEKEKISTAWIFNSILDRKDLLLAIAKDFELPVTQDMSLANVLEQLNTFFIDRFDKGYNTAIIIDEAHNLGAQSLETLRMLSNLEHNGQKLVQILLVGQPELKQLIDQPNLRQLRSRISIYLVLDALSPKETQRYVEFKLSNAGSELPVSPKAYALLWQGSCGNIRMINLIMERALYAIMAFGGTSLTPKIMWAALKDIAGYQTDVANALKSRRKKIVLGWSMGMCAGILLLALIPIVPVPNGQANVAQVIMNSWQSTP
jgi:general secretion pathway protein A